VTSRWSSLGGWRILDADGEPVGGIRYVQSAGGTLWLPPSRQGC
jgi:hypothetical protein